MLPSYLCKASTVLGERLDCCRKLITTSEEYLHTTDVTESHVCMGNTLPQFQLGTSVILVGGFLGYEPTQADSRNSLSSPTQQQLAGTVKLL